MNTGQQYGFTLWELLMTLLVGGILLGIGVPNVMEFQRNGAMTAAANNLVTGVLMARNEAVKRQAPVTLCLSDNPIDPAPDCAPNAVADSTRGFIVFVDENDNTDPVTGARILGDPTDGNGAVDADELVLMQSVGFTDTIRVSTNCAHVVFGASGFPQTAAGLCAPATRDFLYCDDRGRRPAAGGLSAARLVRIDRPGRAMVIQETAVIDGALVGGLGATCPP